MTLKLFVADDSITIQKIVSLAFSDEDVAIESATDGISALESIRSFRPDIVLADVFMPGCTGYEVCERIKEDPVLRQTPVILLVGTFEPFDQVEAARVRCDRYFTKPFDTSELIQAVHSLVAQNQTVESAEAAPAAEPSKEGSGCSTSGTMVSAAAWESFLGESRILDLFGPESVAAAKSGSTRSAILNPAEKTRSEARLSEDAINAIVDRVVRKMSSEVIREVAWEVVPELSESIIRSTIREQNKYK
jgi:CheY-like chemotaxis protein